MELGELMHVVIGVWEMDPARSEMQTGEWLDRIVAGVRQAPGLVKGYWAADSTANRSHTFIVFSNRPDAEAFAADVRGNIDNQAGAGVSRISLDIAEVSAET